MRWLRPGGVPAGVVQVPGDKSLSHRALIFAALCPGELLVRGLSLGEDVAATRRALGQLGVPLRASGDDFLVGDPPGGLLGEPDAVIDCGNSGTSMRLLAGVLAGRDVHAVLTGDASLRQRPMARVVEPLRAMGARIDGRAGGRLAPLALRGGGLCGIEHRSPVASAQVKSCLLLAGLEAEGTTVVLEPSPSRDHTERMLRAFGVELETLPQGVALRGGQRLRPPRSGTLEVPRDLSAAAFFLVLAALQPGATLRLPGVGVNPTRDGILEVLAAAGVVVQRLAPRLLAGEDVADLVVTGGALRPFAVGGTLVPRLIDEIPILAVLAACADGPSTFRDVSELRGKESDRIASTCAMLAAFGVRVEPLPDGFVVYGHAGRPLTGGGAVDAQLDHRIAMAATVAAVVADGPTRLTGGDPVDTSFPGFHSTLERCLVR